MVYLGNATYKQDPVVKVLGHVLAGGVLITIGLLFWLVWLG